MSITTLPTASTASTATVDDQDEPQAIEFKLAQAVIEAETNAADAGSWATKTDSEIVNYDTQQENDVMEINNNALDAQNTAIVNAKDSTTAEREESTYTNMNQKAQASMQTSNSAISQENTEMSNLQSFTSALFSTFGTIVNSLSSVTSLINHTLV